MSLRDPHSKSLKQGVIGGTPHDCGVAEIGMHFSPAGFIHACNPFATTSAIIERTLYYQKTEARLISAATAFKRSRGEVDAAIVSLIRLTAPLSPMKVRWDQYMLEKEALKQNVETFAALTIKSESGEILQAELKDGERGDRCTKLDLYKCREKMRAACAAYKDVANLDAVSSSLHDRFTEDINGAIEQRQKQLVAFQTSMFNV